MTKAHSHQIRNATMTRRTAAHCAATAASPTGLASAGLTALALLLAAGPFACSEDGPATDSSGPAESALPGMLAAEYCAAGATCCGEAGLPANAACISEVSSQVSASIEWAKKQGYTAYSAEDGASCLAALRGAANQCMADTAQLFGGQGYPGYGVGPCGIFHLPPHVALGEPCEASSDCLPTEGGEVQCSSFDASSAVCVQVHRVAAGDPCGQTNVPNLLHMCQEDSSCVDAICVPPAPEGAPCDYLTKCEAGLVCGGGPVITESNTCERYPGGLPTGAMCDDSAQCASGSCGLSSTCSAPSLGKAGEPCVSEYDCLSMRCEYDQLAKRKECGPLDPTQAGMVNANTCNVHASVDAGSP